ncbi:DUF1572 family protein [Flavobacterium sp. RSP15]|uniref:DUF1572 family protein n=1 Tax=Flavobacterium sp. RSP15 TaxID=2497485 RepID=UPI000F82B35D|nr:DUF1572 family protein [Flavobacterium sp. RSP15]RTY87314.1 DUF1572 domain-containing protein [Flavobacterium sp. RSP15]
MLTDILKILFIRDLNILKSEIESYENKSDIWKTQKGITNSAGNLCLHIIGNLNTYIGAQYGKTGYIRNRPLEFSLKDISRTELLSKIKETIIILVNALNTLSEEVIKLIAERTPSLKTLSVLLERTNKKRRDNLFQKIKIKRPVQLLFIPQLSL